jgi:hypothetical protein
MGLVLSYAALAVAVPALWVGARLWVLRDPNRAKVPAPSAQVIHFPCDFRRHTPHD